MFRIAGAVLSGLLYGALFPPFAMAPAAWVALVPLALALRGARGRAAAALAFGFGAVATASVVAWLVPTLTGHFEQGLPAATALWLGVALGAAAPWLALVYGLAAPALARARPLRAALLFAVCWVSAEWLRTRLGLRSPWAPLGASQADALRLAQLADATGVYGVGAVLALTNAALAELARAGRGRARRSALAAVGLAAAVVLSALAYGSLRLATPRAEEPAFEVAVVQGDVSPALRWRRSAAARVLARYASLTQASVAAEPPDLVIWPEHALQVPPDDPLLGPTLRLFVERAKVPLLLGAPRHARSDGAGRVYNSAFLLEPGAARAPLHYDKRVLLPFSETRLFGWLPSLGAQGDLDADGYAAGEGPGVFGVGARRLGVLICLEALYPDLARELAREGADALVNLSHDGWYGGSGGAAQHLAQVRGRAIETRRPLVRSTTTGISAVVAPDGSLAAALPAEEARVLRARVPAAWPGETLYVRVGDVFAGLCVAVWLAVAGRALASRCRSRRDQDEPSRSPAVPSGVAGSASGR